MKKALVLPGGGACGEYQVGAIKRVSELGKLQGVDGYVGTSVGGLTALCLAKAKGDPTELLRIWENIKSSKDIYKGMFQFGSVWDDIGMANQTFHDNAGTSVLDPTPLYNIIDKTFGDMRMQDLPVDVLICTVNLTQGKKWTFTRQGTPLVFVRDVAKATCAIPGIFPAIMIEGELHSDGGAVRNNPVCYAIDAGATDILLIGTSPDTYPPKQIRNKLLDVGARLLEIEMHENEEESWEELERHPETKVTSLYPKTDTGSALAFGRHDLFKMGYAGAVAVLG